MHERQQIEMTSLTLKRLRNYQRIVENALEKASRAQWRDMTLENMQKYEAARQTAGRIGSVAAYADYLFRVQNGLTPYHSIYGEDLLTNALVEVLAELDIPVELTEGPTQTTQNLPSS